MKTARRGLAFRAGTVLVLLLWAGSAAAQDFDNEFWLDQRVAVRLSPRTSLRLNFAERLDRGASNLGEGFLQFGVALEARPWLTITPGYRFTSTNSLLSSASHEHRPQLDLSVHSRHGNWRPSLRTRLEGRFPDGRAASLRIRLRPEASYTLPVGGDRRPALAVSNEFFYDFKLQQYTRNRIQLGIWLPATQRLSLQPYFMVESNRLPGSWDHDNIWGLSLAWSL